MAKDLVELIKANPGCVAIVDNDGWVLYREHPYNSGPAEDSPNRAAWEKANELATESDIDRKKLPDNGYGSGSSYGGDLLQALAHIVGIKVESV